MKFDIVVLSSGCTEKCLTHKDFHALMGAPLGNDKPALMENTRLAINQMAKAFSVSSERVET